MDVDNQVDRIDARENTFRILEELRESGWRVAIHNDYRIGLAESTFWLLTHPSGIYVKGEGRSDLAALTQCAEAASKIFKPSP
jgi:hypothetical protein